MPHYMHSSSFYYSVQIKKVYAGGPNDVEYHEWDSGLTAVVAFWIVFVSTYMFPDTNMDTAMVIALLAPRKAGGDCKGEVWRSLAFSCAAIL